MNAEAEIHETTAAGRSAVTEGAKGTPAVTAMPSIADQADEVGKELRNRERYYPGRLTREVAERKLEHMRAAHKTLLLIAKHAEGLRLLIKVLQRVERFGPAQDDKYPIDDSEAEILLQLPAVRNVLAAFPGCELDEIRAISTLSDAETEEQENGAADL
jgi:hypothetical protein